MNPDNGLPQLPSFKSSQKKEEKKAPGGLPSAGGKEMPSFLRSAPKGGSPMLRVRGLGGGTSLMERLKSLQKKDIAFIAAGLSVLVMAPLAEHFLMSPEDQAGQLQKGFSTNASFPGDVGSVYDPGVGGGMSPGGLLGQGSDVITPLNVRDPSALIMGPGAAQKPSAVVDTPAVPSKGDNSAWKDALAAAQKGAATATRKASLPMPHPKLAAGLRGLGAVGGGGGGSYSPPAVSSQGVPKGPAGSNSLQRVAAAPGYKGTAGRALAAGGGAEGLKNAGNAAAGHLNQGGSAAGALDQAAREALPKGGAGFGGPGAGDESKGPGSGSGKTDKTLGESLEFLRQKMEMEKALELKWKKKNWNEFERQKMVEETIIKSALENIVGKGIFEPIGKAMADALGSVMGGGDPTLYCYDSPGGVVNKGSSRGSISSSNWKACRKGVSSGKEGVGGPLCDDINKNNVWCAGGGDDSSTNTGTNTSTDSNAVPQVQPAGGQSQDNQTGPTNINNGAVTAASELQKAQTNLNSISDPLETSLTKCTGASGKPDGSVSAEYCAAVKVMKPKKDAYQKVIKNLGSAGDHIRTASKHLANGVTAAQNELTGNPGRGVDGLNTKLGKTETKFQAAHDGLQQNAENPSLEFKLPEKAATEFKAGQAQLETTKPGIAGVEKMVPELNKGIQLATNVLEKNQDSSKTYLAAANEALNSGEASAQIPEVPAGDFNHSNAEAMGKVLDEVGTTVKDQYWAMAKVQATAIGVRDELVGAQKAVHAYSEYTNAMQSKQILTGDGADRKVADGIEGGVGDMAQAVVQAAALTKGQFAAAGGATSDNPIVKTALDLWKTNVTVPCAPETPCDANALKAAVAAYNTALQGETATLQPLVDANKTAADSFKKAKETADKVGSSAKTLSASASQ